MSKLEMNLNTGRTGIMSQQNVFPVKYSLYCNSITESEMLEDIFNGKQGVTFKSNRKPSAIWKWAVVHVDQFGERSITLAHNEEFALSIAEQYLQYSGGNATVTTRERIFNE